MSACTQVSGPKDSPCLPPVHLSNSALCMGVPASLGVSIRGKGLTRGLQMPTLKKVYCMYLCVDGWAGTLYACGHASQDMRGDQRTIFRSSETFRSPSPMWVLGVELT